MTALQLSRSIDVAVQTFGGLTVTVTAVALIWLLVLAGIAVCFIGESSPRGHAAWLREYKARNKARAKAWAKARASQGS